MEKDPISIAKWKETAEYKELDKLATWDLSKIVSEKFFRDPLRPIYRKFDVLYSVADGVVLYAYENVGPDDALLDVKGRKFTPKELLADPTYKTRSLIIGVFMTFFNVHVNRVPCDSFLFEDRDTEFLHTHGISMLAVEKEIFGRKKLSSANMGYLFRNQRKVIDAYAPKIKSYYHMVQIADKEVQACVNWAGESFVHQGDRFGMIRWGSQVDLIVEIDEYSPKFQLLVKEGDCVKAGLTEVVKICGKGAKEPLEEFDSLKRKEVYYAAK